MDVSGACDWWVDSFRKVGTFGGIGLLGRGKGDLSVFCRLFGERGPLGQMMFGVFLILHRIYRTVSGIGLIGKNDLSLFHT